MPMLVVPHHAPSQSVGTISLVTDSLNRREKQALRVLFDLTEAFRAHLQIIYTGRQQRQACSFRQALKELALASRLDVIRHTYHFVQPLQLQELVNPGNADWLVLFKGSPSTKSEMDSLRSMVAQSQVPLLLLPAMEAANQWEPQPAITREMAAFAAANRNPIGVSVKPTRYGMADLI